jgi:hypothetical protein
MLIDLQGVQSNIGKYATVHKYSLRSFLLIVKIELVSDK